MADIQRPTGVVYPDLPRLENNLRSAMVRRLFSQREREYTGYSSDIAENHSEIEERGNINTIEATPIIVNGINRMSKGGFFSDDETTSTLSELSSGHDSSLDSLDSLDNYQNSFVDASENIQSDSNCSENGQSSTFNETEKNQETKFNGSDKDTTYSDSDKVSYYDNYETNNINDISSSELLSPPFTLPQDQSSYITPQNQEPSPELPENNNEICSSSISKYNKNIERENGENNNSKVKKNLGVRCNSENESNCEESEDDLTALNFIQAKIEELAKWKKDVWTRLREQSESSSTPEPRGENGISVDVSANNSTPKAETNDTSIKVQSEDESRSTILIRQNENLISSYHNTDEPIESNSTFTNNESKGSNPVPYYERPESNRSRNESTAFSNHERNEFGSFPHDRVDRKFFPVSDRFESFLYSNYERDSRLFFDDRYDTRSYPDDRYETFLYENSERNDLCRFPSHERNDPGRFLNHERLDPNGSLINRQDDDTTAFHQQLPPVIKRHNEQQNAPLGPIHKRFRHMSNGFYYDPMNHAPNNSIYGPPPTGPSGMTGNGMMGRGREDQYHHYYHRNDYRPPPYFDRQGPYGRGHMNNNISRRPIGLSSRLLSRPQERPRGRY
ncbi:11408_t:CDS:2 [Scutellospora calospora]|uniref:11408_t:CDS:1 n=1 Tax=Scutellospora calospora TaxID=85575 RepID=A0ACA9K109_9GLOM|nr:11408_t:CDS:2 [Scutellospora calospora]